MTGKTDNDNLLAAANQIIVVLNDLKATLSTLELTSNCAPNINVESATPDIKVECAPDVNVSCGPGGGSGGIPGDIPLDQIGDGPQGDEPDRGSDPPGGFDTWDEFDEYKCQAANWVFDKYTDTLGNLAAFSGVVGGLTLAVVAGILLLTVPPVGLVAIMVALSVLIGIDIGLCANFTDIKGALESDRQNIVCGLFNATDTQAAIAVLNNATDSIIDNLSHPVTVREQLKHACRNLLWNDNTRLLFEFDEEIAAYTGSVDCSSCGDECDVEWEYLLGSGPTPIPTDGSLFTINSEIFSGNGYNYIAFRLPDCACPEQHTLEIVSVSGNPSNGWSVQSWRSESECPNIGSDRTPAGATATPGTWENTMRFSQVDKNNSFSISFRITA